ncbi:MAG TPA: Fic family protein, partial [Candidatus Massiliomicrobiota merdigallinarum]|nr:Fic family protein [Candidatus Massilimicrobiota merdigallinarum]
ASYLHACFENIHPFADANGRTGRTIMNYYLLIHNVSPIIIYEEDRKEYYNCLEKFDVDSELQPLKDFIIRQQEKTWTRNSKKAMKLNEIMNKDENQNTFEMNDIEESNDEMELE